MVTVINPGKVVNGYTIQRKLNSGAFALAYEAKDSAGTRVFFKQYKSPSPPWVKWYPAYVEYQKELKKRIESQRAKEFTYRFIEFFESKDVPPLAFYQVFEYVDNGDDLEKILLKAKNKPSSLSWDQRVMLAKVMMAGIHALHDAKIVHCDLKPANIYLFSDDSVAAGYRLKIIDMDFSILTDRQAPWDGHVGYVTTPSYSSPEHLLGKGAPQTASDIFTCGLMLCELLTQGHPYQFEDEESYRTAVLQYRAAKPRLLGRMPQSAGTPDNEQVETFIYRCLSPNPTDRPKAQDILAVLNGMLSGPITLTSVSGKVIQSNLDLAIGKTNTQSLGEDAQFMDNPQFKLVRDARRGWLVEPNPQAKNETILNAKAITTLTPLKTGDVLGVGKEAKGILKLPMTVKIG